MWLLLPLLFILGGRDYQNKKSYTFPFTNRERERVECIGNVEWLLLKKEVKYKTKRNKKE
jgi:hypothetical protein